MSLRKHYLIQRARMRDRLTAALGRLGLALVPSGRWRKLTDQRDRMFRELAAMERCTGTAPLHGIIFSKDRPLQVEGLINSYFGLVTNPAPLTVLFRASGPEFRAAYEELRQRLGTQPVRFVEEISFRADMVRLLAELDSERVFFLVDDDIFIRPFDMDPLKLVDTSKYVASMRLGLNLSHCYTAGRPMPLPPHTLVEGTPFITWHWQDGTLDWAYPMATDGHIFSRAEMALLAKVSDFVAPNSFEDAMVSFASVFEGRPGLAYAASRLMNIPANIVQTEVKNFAASISTDELLHRWQQGYQVDWRKLTNYANHGVHLEIELPLVKMP